jgi:FkbM family methyltransferase
MQFFCVEAEPGNFRALQYNVSGLRDRVKVWNVALSDADGPMRFFRDKDNIGNYSLNDDAMRGRQFDSITVQTVATDQWMAAHVRLEPGDRIVWKSDTQGYDELIISLTPLEIWARWTLLSLNCGESGSPTSIGQPSVEGSICSGINQLAAVTAALQMRFLTI